MICLFCKKGKETGEGVAQLTARGYTTCEEAARKSGKVLLPEFIIGSHYHNSCRLSYQRELRKEVERELRSSDRKGFEFRIHCLYCERLIGKYTDSDQKDVDWIHPRLKSLCSYVETASTSGSKSFQASLFDQIEERLKINPGDEWAIEVKGRIAGENLRAVDAIYDRDCAARFRTGKKRPGDSPSPSGTPVDQERRTKLKEVVSQLRIQHEDDGGMRVSDIHEELLSQWKGTEHEPYSMKSIIRILDNEYPDMTVINSFVLFHESVDDAVKAHVRELKKQTDFNKQAASIVKRSAQLISGQITEYVLNADKATYFSSDDLTLGNMLEKLPTLLRIFLEGLYPRRIKPNLKKVAGVGQAVMSLVPRKNKAPMPLPVALSATIHKRTGSRLVIDILSSFGLVETYTEIIRLNRNLAVMDHAIVESSSDWSDIYVADNADAIIETEDGKRSLHITGRIVATLDEIRTADPIPRRIVKDAEIASVEPVKLVPFYKTMMKAPTKVFSDWKGEPERPSLEVITVELMRVASATENSGIPSFYGAIRQLLKGTPANTPAHQVIALSFIDLKADDLTSLRSVMEYAIETSKKQGKKAIVVFDQPLCLSALEIKASLGLEITVMVGNFHTRLSYMAGTGYHMKNTGIEAALNVVFSDISVKKILDGKNYRRCLRAYTIISSALKEILVKQLDPVSISEAAKLYQSLANDPSRPLDVTTLASNPVMVDLLEQYTNLRDELAESPLFSLWLLFIDMIDTLNLNIYAEKTGCWETFITSLKLMLPVMASGNRSKYTKILRWLLDEYSELPAPVVEQFIGRGWVVRTSDTCIYGCCHGDYTIETCLMGSFKGKEGLTRGRGLSPLQRKLWILNRTHLITIDNHVRAMAGLSPSTSVSSSLKPTVIAREKKWVAETVAFFEARSMFDRNAVSQFPKIINISTGYVAPDYVNIDKAVDIGTKILDSMNGKIVGSFKWSMADCARQMPPTPRVRGMANGKTSTKASFDTNLALQRIMVNTESVSEAFSHELADYPPSMFQNGLMRDPGKSRYANKLIELFGNTSEVELGVIVDPVIVHDGGRLIQTLIKLWERGKTIGDICDEIVACLVRETREVHEIIVVLDGYLGVTTKGHVQRQRNPTRSLSCQVRRETVLDVPAGVFLSNPDNKQGFVDLLSATIDPTPRLSSIKCPGDADRTIVTTALSTLQLHSPVVIKADDTDVLVLALNLIRTNGLFLKRNGKVFDINKFRESIQPVLRDNILTLHAFYGCDTTSAFFGKPSYRALSMDWNHLVSKLAVFREKDSSIPEIHDAGVHLIAAMYRCEPDLDTERAKLFKVRCNSKISKRQVSLDRLPPTIDAAHLHSERAFLTIQEWEGNPLEPEGYGWILEDGMLEPLPMRQKPGPHFLMDVKMCGCTTGCDTQRCSFSKCKKWKISKFSHALNGRGPKPNFSIADFATNSGGVSRDPIEYPSEGISLRTIMPIRKRHMPGLQGL
eukprot:sb/3460887/